MSFGKQLLTTAFMAELKIKFEEDAKQQKRETVIYFSEDKDTNLKQKFKRFEDVLKTWSTGNEVKMAPLHDIDHNLIGYNFTL
jgi:predicted lipoprotein